MKYVALLRGINVGGKTRVEMSRLKGVFEGIGCQQVTTYINSDNVLFSDDRKDTELVKLIEAAILQEFGFVVPVVVRSDKEIQAICEATDAAWSNDTEQKTDVMFLWENIDGKDILDKVKINPDIENVRYVPGALIWNIGRKNVTRGGGIRLIKTDLYKSMTVRNINTVRKLAGLLKNML